MFTLGKFELAVNLLKEAIKRDPLVLQNLQRLGLLYEFSGKYEEALVAYQMLYLNWFMTVVSVQSLKSVK